MSKRERKRKHPLPHEQEGSGNVDKHEDSETKTAMLCENKGSVRSLLQKFENILCAEKDTRVAKVRRKKDPKRSNTVIGIDYASVRNLMPKLEEVKPQRSRTHSASYSDIEEEPVTTSVKSLLEKFENSFNVENTTPKGKGVQNTLPHGEGLRKSRKVSSNKTPVSVRESTENETQLNNPVKLDTPVKVCDKADDFANIPTEEEVLPTVATEVRRNCSPEREVCQPPQRSIKALLEKFEQSSKSGCCVVPDGGHVHVHESKNKLNSSLEFGATVFQIAVNDSCPAFDDSFRDAVSELHGECEENMFTEAPRVGLLKSKLEGSTSMPDQPHNNENKTQKSKKIDNPGSSIQERIQMVNNAIATSSTPVKRAKSIDQIQDENMNISQIEHSHPGLQINDIEPQSYAGTNHSETDLYVNTPRATVGDLRRRFENKSSINQKPFNSEKEPSDDQTLSKSCHSKSAVSILRSLYHKDELTEITNPSDFIDTKLNISTIYENELNGKNEVESFTDKNTYAMECPDRPNEKIELVDSSIDPQDADEFRITISPPISKERQTAEVESNLNTSKSIEFESEVDRRSDEVPKVNEENEGDKFPEAALSNEENIKFGQVNDLVEVDCSGHVRSRKVSETVSNLEKGFSTPVRDVCSDEETSNDSVRVLADKFANTLSDINATKIFDEEMKEEPITPGSVRRNSTIFENESSSKEVLKTRALTEAEKLFFNSANMNHAFDNYLKPSKSKDNPASSNPDLLTVQEEPVPPRRSSSVRLPNNCRELNADEKMFFGGNVANMFFKDKFVKRSSSDASSLTSRRKPLQRSDFRYRGEGQQECFSDQEDYMISTAETSDSSETDESILRGDVCAGTSHQLSETYNPVLSSSFVCVDDGLTHDPSMISDSSKLETSSFTPLNDFLYLPSTISPSETEPVTENEHATRDVEHFAPADNPISTGNKFFNYPDCKPLRSSSLVRTASLAMSRNSSLTSLVDKTNYDVLLPSFNEKSDYHKKLSRFESNPVEHRSYLHCEAGKWRKRKSLSMNEINLSGLSEVDVHSLREPIYDYTSSTADKVKLSSTVNKTATQSDGQSTSQKNNQKGSNLATHRSGTDCLREEKCDLTSQDELKYLHPNKKTSGNSNVPSYGSLSEESQSVHVTETAKENLFSESLEDSDRSVLGNSLANDDGLNRVKKEKPLAAIGSLNHIGSADAFSSEPEEIVSFAKTDKLHQRLNGNVHFTPNGVHRPVSKREEIPSREFSSKITARPVASGVELHPNNILNYFFGEEEIDWDIEIVKVVSFLFWFSLCVYLFY